MKEICGFVGIESNCYRGYNFRIENRTGTHRNAYVRRAGQLNFRFEPFLNRFPAFRRAGRDLYDLLNVNRNQQIEFTSSSRAELDAYLAPWNPALRDLMAENYPQNNFRLGFNLDLLQFLAGRLTTRKYGRGFVWSTRMINKSCESG